MSAAAPRPPTRRVAVGLALGVVLAWLVGHLVALAPTQVPERRPINVPTAEVGSGVTISFVTTGETRIRGTRLHQGAGLSRHPIAFRAALIQHPRGALLFGTGIDDEGPGRLGYDPFGGTRSAELPDALPEVRNVVLPTPRWLHMGGLADPRLADARVLVGQGDLWQLRSGPWPRRYGMNRGAFERDRPNLQRMTWPRESRLGFSKSRDVFDDGTVVLVGLRGSTIDEIGLLVRADSGTRYLLVADAVWAARQISERLPRPPWSTWLFDRNRMQLAHTIAHLNALEDAGVVVLPMLDGALELPEYPDTLR